MMIMIGMKIVITMMMKMPGIANLSPGHSGLSDRTRHDTAAGPADQGPAGGGGGGGGPPGNRDEEQRRYNVIMDRYERLMERYHSLTFRYVGGNN